MYKLEKLNSILKCKLCFNLLHDPILLPCGKTICKSHSSEVNKSQCPLCPETHVMPGKGFPMNEVVQELLEIELNKLNINFKHFDECKLLIRELKTSLNGIETLEKDPAYYITEQFQELNRQVDLKKGETSTGYQRLEPMTKHYKRRLLKNKIFQLTTRDINIDQIFGSFEIRGVKILLKVLTGTLRDRCGAVD